MSKSYNNAIYLADTKDQMKTKIKNIVTDPARIRRTDPGDPEKCVAYEFHKIFSTEDENELTAGECRTAARGCVDCKKMLANNIFKMIDPLISKREYWLQRPGEVMDILIEGTKKARPVAQETLAHAQEAMGIDVLAR